MIAYHWVRSEEKYGSALEQSRDPSHGTVMLIVPFKSSIAARQPSMHQGQNGQTGKDLATVSALNGGGGFRLAYPVKIKA